MSLIERLKAFLSGTPTPPRTRDATPTPNTDEDAAAGTSSEAAASRSTSGASAPKPDAPTPRMSSSPPQGTPSTPEHATQFDGVDDSKARDDLYLVIGFDWGTSCTKVVIRDPYGSNVSYAVPLNESDQTANPYLLPSTLYLDAERRAHLSYGPHRTALSSLKIDVMDGAQAVGGAGPVEPVRPSEAAALFVAAAVRRARQWLLETWSERYRQYRIEWQLNLGIPAASYDDRERCAHFKLIARIGWQLSTREGPLTIDAARRAFKQARATGVAASETTPVTHVVPEVAAQVVGYAKSTLRRDGLHVLVDVGASTFDVAAFNLHQREGEDTYSIYTTYVTRDGAFALHRARLDYIDEYADQLTASPQGEHSRHNPMCLVPYDLAAYFPERKRSEIRRLVRANGVSPDQRFRKRCFQTLHRTFHDLRQTHYPDAPAWTTGVPIFTCGGGRHLAPYRGALRDLNGWWQDNTPVAEFKDRELQHSEDLLAEAVPEESFHRLSVAYGLSFPIWDIGQLRPPGDIPDLPVHEETTERVFHEDTKDWT